MLHGEPVNVLFIILHFLFGHIPGFNLVNSLSTKKDSSIFYDFGFKFAIRIFQHKKSILRFFLWFWFQIRNKDLYWLVLYCYYYNLVARQRDDPLPFKKKQSKSSYLKSCIFFTPVYLLKEAILLNHTNKGHIDSPYITTCAWYMLTCFLTYD